MLQIKKSRMKRAGPESGCVRSPCMYTGVRAMSCKYLIVCPRKHVCGTVRTHFRRLCLKAHHGCLHRTVSAGFSEGGTALRGMYCCVEAAEAFIPLHGERRSAVLTFSRHLGRVKLCPSITNSSRLPLSCFSSFESHFKYSTKQLA